jgi:hypothetical protein
MKLFLKCEEMAIDFIKRAKEDPVLSGKQTNPVYSLRKDG